MAEWYRLGFGVTQTCRLPSTSAGDFFLANSLTLLLYTKVKGLGKNVCLVDIIQIPKVAASSASG